MGNDARPIRMLAFVGEGVFSSVLDSQVVVPLRHIGRVAPNVQRGLLVLTSQRHRNDPRTAQREQTIRAALTDAHLDFRLRLPMHLPFERARWSGALRRFIAECGYTGDAPIVVHCRGTLTTAAAGHARARDGRLRILLDLRGDPIDETKGRGLRARYYQAMSRRNLHAALAAADGLNTVSQKLATHLQTSGLLTRALPSTVVGCCVDTERFGFDPAVRAARRAELSFGDKFVVCYCGSMARYQRPDAVAAAFAAIRRVMPDAHMFALSGDAGPFVEHLQRAGVGTEDITVRSAPHEQVGAYLMAADLGLLLRENSMTNLVASPVKFAEYLRSGLPVMLTPYVGDFSAFVTSMGCGAVVEFPVDGDEVVQAALAIRARVDAQGDAGRAERSQLAGDNFSWDVQVRQLLQMYETLSR